MLYGIFGYTFFIMPKPNSEHVYGNAFQLSFRWVSSAYIVCPDSFFGSFVCWSVCVWGGGGGGGVCRGLIAVQLIFCLSSWEPLIPTAQNKLLLWVISIRSLSSLIMLPYQQVKLNSPLLSLGRNWRNTGIHLDCCSSKTFYVFCIMVVKTTGMETEKPYWG